MCLVSVAIYERRRLDGRPMHARPSGSQGARASLRAATREVHERLHLSPDFLAISEGRLDRHGYGELLGRLAAIYFALAPELGIDGVRMERLARDLLDLDVPRPEPVRWQPPSDDAARLGWQYVVQGSIFGGQVIYRQLDYLFGEVEDGRRFFAGVPNDGDRWRSLCREFERAGEEEGDLRQMIGGSRAAFALFERELFPEYVHG
jgi:heme oxygenase